MISKKEWKKKVLDFQEQTKRIIYNMKDPDNFAPTMMLWDGEKLSVGVIPMDKYDFHELIVRIAIANEVECISTAMVMWYIPPEAIREEDKDKDGKYIGPMPSKHPKRKEGLVTWSAYGKEQFAYVTSFTRNSDGSVNKYTELDLPEGGDMMFKNNLYDRAYEALQDRLVRGDVERIDLDAFRFPRKREPPSDEWWKRQHEDFKP